MKLFDTPEVMGMSDGIVDKIIAEDEQAKEARRALDLDLERIEDAKKKCDVVAVLIRRREASHRLNNGYLCLFGHDSNKTCLPRKGKQCPAVTYTTGIICMMRMRARMTEPGRMMMATQGSSPPITSWVLTTGCPGVLSN